MDNSKSTLSFAHVTFSFLSQFLVQSERQCSPLFCAFSSIRKENILRSSKCFLNEESNKILQETTLNK